jgi:hypothetical protein
MVRGICLMTSLEDERLPDQFHLETANFMIEVESLLDVRFWPSGRAYQVPAAIPSPVVLVV